MKLRSFLIGSIAALCTGSVLVWGQSGPGPGINSNFPVIWSMAWDMSTVKPTYSFTGTMAVQATPTDVCTLQGNASKIIKVRRILLNGSATAVSTEPVAIIKRSTVDTNGGVIQTNVKYDTQMPTAVGVGEIWTANGTLGTAVGTLQDPFLTWNNLTTGVGAPLIITFGQLGAPVFLRLATDMLAVNLNNLTIAGGNLACTFEWTEE